MWQDKAPPACRHSSSSPIPLLRTPVSGSYVQVRDLHTGAPTKLGQPGLCPQETYKGGGERSPPRTTQGKRADLVKGQKVLWNVREEETALDHCREGSRKRWWGSWAQELGQWEGLLARRGSGAKEGAGQAASLPDPEREAGICVLFWWSMIPSRFLIRGVTPCSNFWSKVSHNQSAV